MTHPERIAEADHDREGSPNRDERDPYPAGASPEGEPARTAGDPSRAGLPGRDLGLASEVIREGTPHELR